MGLKSTIKSTVKTIKANLQPSFAVIVYRFIFHLPHRLNLSPLGLIEQASLGKFSLLVAIEIESSWDRPVVLGFDAKEDAPEHGQGHDADDDVEEPLHAEALPETAARVICLQNR